MSNVNCRAQDPAKCPYHGAVIRMDSLKDKMINDFVAQNKPVPSSLLEAYTASKDEVERKVAEGWDEDAFAALWGGSPSSQVDKGKSEVNETKQAVESRANPSDNEDKVYSTSPAALNSPLAKVVSVLDGEEIEFERADLYDLNNVPKFIRLQFHAPLSKVAKAQFASMIQYSLKVAFKDARLELQTPSSDSSHSFVINLDALKAKKDYATNMTNFGRMLKVFVREGTPKRPTRNDTRKLERVKAENASQFKLYFAKYE